MSASIEVTMNGDEAKLYRSFQKLMAGQKQVEEGFGKIAKSSMPTKVCTATKRRS